MMIGGLSIGNECLFTLPDKARRVIPKVPSPYYYYYSHNR